MNSDHGFNRKTFCLVAVPQKDAVTVRLEEGMVLECLCPWQGSFSMVSWTKPPKKNPIAIFHPEFGISFSDHYQERIEFLRSTPMDGSISLKNVTHQDIGVYHCSVQSFPQGSWTKSIWVEDLGKRGGNSDLLLSTTFLPLVTQASTLKHRPFDLFLEVPF